MPTRHENNTSVHAGPDTVSRHEARLGAWHRCTLPRQCALQLTPQHSSRHLDTAPRTLCTSRPVTHSVAEAHDVALVTANFHPFPEELTIP
ncbi:hypothetical protein O988_07331 [Pseudogymnoascus sp. VKM F-3808]|nr:hypothetical protein O988_07331 [Pseudogymnoascus sp. VKM F-3808]